MCPPPRPKSAVQYIIEAAIECARRNPELWMPPEPDIDALDYAGV